MKFEIKNRWNGELIFSIETDSWRLAVEAAIKAKADLRYANLSSANLSYANLSETKNAELALAQIAILPSDGPLFGWKKCRDNVLVKLFIPSKARRSHGSGRKCRAERAKVIEVIGAEKGISIYSSSTVYEVGKWVRCDQWNENRWQECDGGIHFFIQRAEAEAWI